MKVHLQILGTNTIDTTPSLLFFFDNQRYLFNCGEATQRLCTEYKIRLAKAKHIFLTRMSWLTLGGLPGALLTISDVGVTNLSIYGPPKLKEFIESMHYFVSRADLTLRIQEFRDNDSHQTNIIQDELTKIRPILVLSEGEKIIINHHDQKELLRIEEQFDHLQSYPNHDKNKYTLNEGHSIENNVHIIQMKHDLKSWKKSVQLFLGQTKIHQNSDQTRSNTSLIGSELVNDSLERLSLIKSSLENNPSCFNSPILDLPHSTLSTSPIECVVCFAFHISDIPGKFNPELADKLKVPKKMRSKLVRGEIIELEQGKIQVHPNECISPSIPGPVFIIIDCPTLSIMKNLVKNDAFKDYQYQMNDRDNFGQNDQPPTLFSPLPSSKGKYYDQVVLVVHMTPSSILNEPIYRSWMLQFHPTKVEHLIINSSFCDKKIVFDTSFQHQSRLYQIDKDIFPLPAWMEADRSGLDHFIREMEHDQLKTNQNDPKIRIRISKPLDKYHLHQGDGLIVFEALKDQPIESESNPLVMDPIIDEALDLVLVDPIEPFPIVEPFEIIFLGTGAALPSKYRNVSSTLVRMNHFGSLLLDVGEGTLGQIFRHYGSPKYLEILLDLKFVFISHMHADHHLGLFRILLERQHLIKINQKNDHINSLKKEKFDIVIIGPPAYGSFLEAYAKIEPIHYKFISSYEFQVDKDTASIPNFLKMSHLRIGDELKSIQIVTIPVIHCEDSFGILIEHQGSKLVYSGDTRPCPLLQKIGKKCHVLIHEATFDDHLLLEAEKKNHSTTSEAIEVARQMEAQYLIMTHFSQRYPKFPSLQDVKDVKYGLAFDLMSIKASQLEKLQKVNQLLFKAFSQEMEEMVSNQCKSKGDSYINREEDGEDDSDQKNTNVNNTKRRISPTIPEQCDEKKMKPFFK